MVQIPWRPVSVDIGLHHDETTRWRTVPVDDEAVGAVVGRADPVSRARRVRGCPGCAGRRHTGLRRDHQQRLRSRLDLFEYLGLDYRSGSGEELHGRDRAKRVLWFERELGHDCRISARDGVHGDPEVVAMACTLVTD